VSDELSLLESIARGRLSRPSEVVPGYPPALEEIVLSAIDPDPERRCPSARALHDRLEELVGSGPLASNTRAVAAWVNELYPNMEESDPQLRASSFAELPETVAELATPIPPPTRRLGPSGGWLGWNRKTAALVVAGVLVGGAGAGALHRPPAPASPAVAVMHRTPPVTRCSSSGAGDESRPTRILYGPTDPGPRGRQAREGLSSARRHRSGRPPDPAASTPAPPPEVAALQDQPLPAATTLTDPLPLVANRSAPLTDERARPVDLSPRPPEEGQSPPATRSELPAVPALRDGIYSVRPRASVPRPSLPKVYTAQGSDDLQGILAAVEEETVKAGCSPEYAHGITGALHRALAGQRAAEVFPAAMYYFIVNEAALGREKKVAEQELRRAHLSGIVRALNRLPSDP
jgi:hypothetical protein